MNLIGSTKPTVSDLMKFVPQNSGAVPLGYLVQRCSLEIFGFSEFSARLPSALSSVLAAYGIFVLSGRLSMRNPLVAVGLFCLLPTQWRYALEARPYAMALAISIWSTVSFFHVLDVPTIRRASVYALLITAGLYTNPYSFFVPAAHVVWLALSGHRSGQAFLANMVALALFLPWFLYARHAWKASVPPHGHITFWKAAELLTREITGAGYLGTALLSILAVVGWRKQLKSSPLCASFLVTWTLVPIPLALFGNAVFHYFLAARQLIFALPPLCLLAAIGIGEVNADR